MQKCPFLYAWFCALYWCQSKRGFHILPTYWSFWTAFFCSHFLFCFFLLVHYFPTGVSCGKIGNFLCTSWLSKKWWWWYFFLHKNCNKYCTEKMTFFSVFLQFPFPTAHISHSHQQCLERGNWHCINRRAPRMYLSFTPSLQMSDWSPLWWRWWWKVVVVNKKITNLLCVFTFRRNRWALHVIIFLVYIKVQRSEKRNVQR